ncbi:uncharacterized protein LOC144437899 [Glandiceps talaboti]
METEARGYAADGESAELLSARQMKATMERQMLAASFDTGSAEQYKDAYTSLCEQISLLENQVDFGEDDGEEEQSHTFDRGGSSDWRSQSMLGKGGYHKWQEKKQHGGGSTGRGGRQRQEQRQQGGGSSGRGSRRYLLETPSEWSYPQSSDQRQRGERGGAGRGRGRQQSGTYGSGESEWQQYGRQKSPGRGGLQWQGRRKSQGGDFDDGDQWEDQGRHQQSGSGRSGRQWQGQRQQQEKSSGRGGRQWQEDPPKMLPTRGRPGQRMDRGGNFSGQFLRDDALDYEESEGFELRSILQLVRRLISKRPVPPGPQFYESEPKRRRPDWMEPPRGPRPFDRPPRPPPLLPSPPSLLSPPPPLLPPPPPRDIRQRHLQMRNREREMFEHQQAMREREALQKKFQHKEDTIKYCEICGVKAVGEISYNMHVSGKKHKQAVEMVIAKVKYPEYGDMPEEVKQRHEDRRRNTDEYMKTYKKRGEIIHDLGDPEKKEDAIKRADEVEKNIGKFSIEKNYCFICICDVGKSNHDKHVAGYKHGRMKEMADVIVKARDAVKEEEIDKLEELLKKYKGMMRHKASDEDKWHCPICDSVFNTEVAYEDHVPKVTHKMRWRCFVVIEENLQSLYEAAMHAAGKPIPEELQDTATTEDSSDKTTEVTTTKDDEKETKMEEESDLNFTITAADDALLLDDDETKPKDVAMDTEESGKDEEGKKPDEATAEESAPEEKTKKKLEKYEKSLITCEICGVKAPGEISYKNHLAGKKHKQALELAELKTKYQDLKEMPKDEKLKQDDKRMGTEVFMKGVNELGEIIKDLGDPQKKEDAIQRVDKVKKNLKKRPGRGNTCATCNCNFGKSNLKIHLSGYKHEIMKESSELIIKVQEAVEKDDTEMIKTLLEEHQAMANTKASSENEWKCHSCEVPCDSSTEYDNHVTTVVHNVRRRCLIIKITSLQSLAKMYGKSEEMKVEPEQADDTTAASDDASKNVNTESGQEEGTEVPSDDVGQEETESMEVEEGEGDKETEKDKDIEKDGDAEGSDNDQDDDDAGSGEDKEDTSFVDEVGDEVQKFSEQFADGYTEGVVTGQTYISPGFYCLVCEEFFKDPEFAFDEHCRCKYHFAKLEVYENRVKEFERAPKRGRRKLRQERMEFIERMQRGAFQRGGMPMGGNQRGGGGFGRGATRPFQRHMRGGGRPQQY